MAKIKIKQIGSPIRRPESQKKILIGLGLGKMHRVVGTGGHARSARRDPQAAAHGAGDRLKSTGPRGWTQESGAAKGCPLLIFYSANKAKASARL
jgi:hypothetical protein